MNFYWHTYKYFPYEKRLAKRELRRLFKKSPSVRKHGLFLETSNSVKKVALKTTYFREVIFSNGKKIIPPQALLEASSNGIPDQQLFSKQGPIYLKRQNTRYSTHGLHEYKGKFNPQIIRVAGNLVGLDAEDWVLDPFCGSGTTLVEAAHIGWNAVGLDINPLAIEISRAKLAALRVDPLRLTKQVQTLTRHLNQRIKGLSFQSIFTQKECEHLGGSSWKKFLPDVNYLQSWFTHSVLVQLSAILQEIEKLSSKDTQLVCKIILSDILRQVSLQDPGDLRIRRRKHPRHNSPCITAFLNKLRAQTSSIMRARQLIGQVKTTQQVILADVKNCFEVAIMKRWPTTKFDAAITSPPYVTALPYIDTQRLSLVLLGLISSQNIRRAEKLLIGNREINHLEKKNLEDEIKENPFNLPAKCLSLVRQMQGAINMDSDGFRRQNMPFLVYQYCRDMNQMFGEVRKLLKRNSSYILVVGRNKTTLGNSEFSLDTPGLLVSLAEQVGFSFQEKIELDTYQRFGVHQSNSIKSETMLILRAS